ncbi:MAG: hypothetical protein KIT22_18810 [Verrucomicrobiae bacterium]|nr:hypothetical protein [Verrucomicrobiae bacterium]
MPWIAIGEDDVLTVLSGKELDAYRAAALAEGQPDPVIAVIAQVVDLVRGYVGAWSGNVLGEGNTIPSKLLATALDLISVRIPQRVGRDPKQVRKDAAASAITLLEQVAAGKFNIESPATPAAELSYSPRPKISRPTRRFSRADEDGL